jgi:hypothetical protein
LRHRYVMEKLQRCTPRSEKFAYNEGGRSSFVSFLMQFPPSSLS